MIIVNVCDVVPDGVSYEASKDVITAHCAKHNACYYARPRESFSLSEAVFLARLQGRE